jgi:hypothetical protein
LTERLLTVLAWLNDDAPKDYVRIFGELGYGPDVEAIDKRYQVFGIRK